MDGWMDLSGTGVFTALIGTCLKFPRNKRKVEAVFQSRAEQVARWDMVIGL